MRRISQQFIDDLNTGLLKPFLDDVKVDDALCLEIREDYINIYYRGGNLFKITPAPRKGGYKVFFDLNYAKSYRKEQLALEEIDPYACDAWIEKTPLLKSVMDSDLSDHPSWRESSNSS